MNIKNLSFLILPIILGSCGTFKNIPYFQDLNNKVPTKEQVANYASLKIQTADILGINVTSRNPESSAIFNYNLNRVNGNNNVSPDNPVMGYMVDQKGEIQLPIIGNLQASGLSTTELALKISQILLTYYKDPVVNVRLLNFKVSVFGDVLRPNVYTLQNERTTITQALSLAGDLNITAIRKIILIRENDGQRNFIPIDLTSKKLFESDYYYLKNNDEIYVPAGKAKYATVDRGYRTASLVLSGLSIIAIVLSNLFR